MVITDMIVESSKRFTLDTPKLVGGTGVWSSTEAAKVLSDRVVSTKWSVDDVVRRRTRSLGTMA